MQLAFSWQGVQKVVFLFALFVAYQRVTNSKTEPCRQRYCVWQPRHKLEAALDAWSFSQSICCLRLGGLKIEMADETKARALRISKANVTLLFFLPSDLTQGVFHLKLHVVCAFVSIPLLFSSLVLLFSLFTATLSTHSIKCLSYLS